MKKLLILFLLAGLIVGCKKDQFEDKPQIKLKSTSADIVPQNSAFRTVLEFTDKQGDLDSVYVIRQRLNRRGAIVAARIPYPVPKFPDNTKGEIQIDFDYNIDLTFGLNPVNVPGSNPQRFEPDSLRLRFVVVDRADHASDTLNVNVIVRR